jgi:hypothetical protein
MGISRLINKLFINAKNINSSQTPPGREKAAGAGSFARGRGEEKESERQTELEIINARLEKLEGDLEKAISGYKLTLINNNPDILPELIGGESIETLDASLLRARELTGRIKENLEKKAASQRTPAGAPSRIPPDTENMSSEEKIKYGLRSNFQ